MPWCAAVLRRAVRILRRAAPAQPVCRRTATASATHPWAAPPHPTPSAPSYEEDAEDHLAVVHSHPRWIVS
ncbi:hypothetical protein, partial [Streptomyces sp. NPDC001948]